MYDAIVVGARCAGSSTAMLLARKGYRVLIVDRATFPSDTISTHIIWPPGVSFLKRSNLLDELIDSNCPAIRQVSFDVGPFALSGSLPPVDGTFETYAPRRKVLDKVLVDAAVESGAELREAFTVTELVTDGHVVTGIRGTTKDGTTVAETAKIVIGADGVHSIVAKGVNAPEYNVKPRLACWYYTYWSGVPTTGVTFYSRTDRAIGVIPTNDGLVCIPIGWAQNEFDQYRADIEGNYMRSLEISPDLAERVHKGKREERFYGTGDVPNFFRKPYGPGWALVGDAGYHKDPITAQGISDAFSSAELLSQAIDEGLSGRRPVDEAMADYQRRRDERVTPMYEFTCQLATLAPPAPAMQQLFSALRTNQEETDRFLGAMAGTVPVSEFYSPENMQRISGRKAHSKEGAGG
jgi:flavin-dependent dehydrogenase